ncbi:hypothetical protein SAMN05444336_101244 [Albimonas donghaensis]|uniref:Uncharacterized protein n=2 Tax=Albimonas donghaensis TaxID=356660 RepID=A0A1H2R7S6_9RHOB|nr:hypothetical protein SAMN05444336_101244 [Albimonas donghaensis]
MMPADKRVERRDRAILAALPPTGARANLASRRHVPPEAFKVWSRNPWPRERADPLAASEIQRNLCAPALVDELRRFRAFRLRMQDMASRMAERQAAEGPALRLLDGGRGDA